MATIGRVSRSFAPAAIILIVGVTVFVSAFVVTKSADDKVVRGVLELQTEWRARDIEQKIVVATASLEALAAFVGSQNHLVPKEFHGFARLAHDDEAANSAMVWAPLVKGPDRADFVARARAAGDTGFDISEPAPGGTGFVSAPEREEYLPLFYEESYDGAIAPHGLDSLSLPERRIWIEEARDEGRPIATPSVTIYLPQGARRPGFLVFWPVYADGDVLASIEDRRAKFLGVAATQFRFDQFLPALLKNTPPLNQSVDFMMDSGRAGDPVQQVGRADAARGGFSFANVAPALAPGAVAIVRSFDILGRHWTLRFTYPPEVSAGLQSGGPWWLLLGLALTALLAIYVQRERTGRAGVEQVVAARTSALTVANQSLVREAEERRAAEAATDRSLALMRAAFDAAPFAVVTVTLDRRVSLWNRAAERIFGYRAEEVLGKVPPEAAANEGGFDRIIARLTKGEIIRDEPTRRRRKDGMVFDALFSGAAIHVDGEVSGFCGIIEDVSERKLVEQQLVQAQKMEAIGNLTGGMAHDFNNMLGIIIGNLDLLKGQSRLASDDEELVDESLTAAFSGAELTRRLLAFARRQPLAPRHVAVNELVTGMVKLLWRTLGEPIQIALDLAPDAWPVIVDPAQLESNIANMATNARDAMPKGGRLTIGTANRHLDADYTAEHPEAVPGDYVMIEVSDTGVGMSPEVMAHIFEPFFTTKERSKGTGLGLSMMFGFLRQSGGHVNVYSEPGVGTTFRLYLPRATAEVAEPPVAHATVSPRGGHETVLVVEDNEALRRVVVRQCTELGYGVIEAPDAASALAVLETRAVDVLLSDVVMPGELDGRALAQRVTEKWPRIKAILMSGFPESFVTGNPAPIDRNIKLLSKPYRKEDLAQALREALER